MTLLRFCAQISLSIFLVFLLCGPLHSSALNLHDTKDYDHGTLARGPLCPEKTCVISYSLYGNDPRYINGAVHNARVVSLGFMYRGWQMRVYHDASVPVQTLNELRHLGVQLVDLSSLPLPGLLGNGRLWRFLVASDPEVDRYVMRDVDTPLLQREEDAVREWVGSTLPFHIMRDHPSHSIYASAGLAVQAGMWGGTRDAMPHMEPLLRTSQLSQDYTADAHFLKNTLWPLAVQRGALQHDAFGCLDFPGSLPFPTRRHVSDGEHVGAVMGSDGELRQADVELLWSALEHQPEQCQDRAVDFEASTAADGDDGVDGVDGDDIGMHLSTQLDLRTVEDDWVDPVPYTQCARSASNGEAWKGYHDCPVSTVDRGVELTISSPLWGQITPSPVPVHLSLKVDDSGPLGRAIRSESTLDENWKVCYATLGAPVCLSLREAASNATLPSIDTPALGHVRLLAWVEHVTTSSSSWGAVTSVDFYVEAMASSSCTSLHIKDGGHTLPSSSPPSMVMSRLSSLYVARTAPNIMRRLVGQGMELTHLPWHGRFDWVIGRPLDWLSRCTTTSSVPGCAQPTLTKLREVPRSIYVSTDHMQEFMSCVLPSLRASGLPGFVLYVGDGDIPPGHTRDYQPQKDWLDFLLHDKLIHHLFLENSRLHDNEGDTTKRITHMPIGPFIGSVVNSSVDLLSRAMVAREAPLSVFLSRRQGSKVLVSFSVNSLERRQVMQWAVDPTKGAKVAYVESPKLSPDAYFDMISRFGFLLCPPGQGSDSFRIFEALALGTIPIVLDAHLADGPYAELPVLYVPSVTSLTAELLQEQWMKLGARVYELQRELTLDYWWSKVESALRSLQSATEGSGSAAVDGDQLSFSGHPSLISHQQQLSALRLVYPLRGASLRSPIAVQLNLSLPSHATADDAEVCPVAKVVRHHASDWMVCYGTAGESHCQSLTSPTQSLPRLERVPPLGLLRVHAWLQHQTFPHWLTLHTSEPIRVDRRPAQQHDDDEKSVCPELREVNVTDASMLRARAVVQRHFCTRLGVPGSRHNRVLLRDDRSVDHPLWLGDTLSPWLLRFDWVLDVALDWPARCHGKTTRLPDCAAPTLTKLRAHQQPSTVFVKIDFLQHFLSCVLPHITAPILLYIGNGDLPAFRDSTWRQRPDWAKVLSDNEFVKDVFAEQAEMTVFNDNSKKFHAMPMGVNPSFLSHSGHRFESAIASAPAPLARSSTVLCAWDSKHSTAHLTSGVDERAEATFFSNGACGKICRVPSQRLGQAEYWRELSRHRFMLSPSGNAYDEPKTWEALSLSTIPILRNHTFARSYVELGLPVVLVDRLDQITEKSLQQWFHQLGPIVSDSVRMRQLLHPDRIWKHMLHHRHRRNNMTNQGSPQGHHAALSPKVHERRRGHPAVEVELKGGLGNNMFQFIAAKLIATAVRAPLRFPTESFTPLFPNMTSWSPPASELSADQRLLNVGQRFVVSDTAAPQRCFASSPAVVGDDNDDPGSSCRGMLHDLLDLLTRTSSDFPETILVRGHFEDYQILQPHKHAIKHEWLALAPQQDDDDGSGADIAVHVRFCEANQPELDRTAIDSKWPVLPLRHYTHAIDRIIEQLYSGATRVSSLRVRLVTPPDCHTSKLTTGIAEHLVTFHGVRDVLVDSRSPSLAFRVIHTASAIVLSGGTFGWLAAWLSDARAVHMPLVGLQSTDRQLPSLVPWDEGYRYIFSDPLRGIYDGQLQDPDGKSGLPGILWEVVQCALK